MIFLLTLRSGLIGALRASGGSLTEETLPEAVFKALGFDRTEEGALAEYLKSPKLVGLARREAQHYIHFLSGYRLMRDLRKGWRFNNPNLDQLRLLKIDYQGLEEFCADESLFVGRHSALQTLGPKGRERLPDLYSMSCAEVYALNRATWIRPNRTKRGPVRFSYLNDRWVFAPDELLATSKLLISASVPSIAANRETMFRGGPRSRMVRLLKAAPSGKTWRWPSRRRAWKEQELAELIEHFLNAASNYGYVQKQKVDGTNWSVGD